MTEGHDGLFFGRDAVTWWKYYQDGTQRVRASFFKRVWFQCAFGCGRIDCWTEVQLLSTSFKKMKIIEILWLIRNGGKFVMTYVWLRIITTQLVRKAINLSVDTMGFLERFDSFR